MDTRLGLVALAVVVTAAACGGSSSGGGDAVTPQSSGGSGSSGSAVTVGTSDGHLVDGTGRSGYLFEADTGSTSTCAGACASAWPPVTTSADAQPDGPVKAAKLGTTQRDDGSTQVTYAGHPLYYYGGDSAPGDTNGQGSEAFGAEWYLVAPSGESVEEGGDGESGGGGGGSDPSPSGYSYP